MFIFKCLSYENKLEILGSYLWLQLTKFQGRGKSSDDRQQQTGGNCREEHLHAKHHRSKPLIRTRHVLRMHWHSSHLLMIRCAFQSFQYSIRNVSIWPMHFDRVFYGTTFVELFYWNVTFLSDSSRTAASFDIEFMTFHEILMVFVTWLSWLLVNIDCENRWRLLKSIRWLWLPSAPPILTMETSWKPLVAFQGMPWILWQKKLSGND